MNIAYRSTDLAYRDDGEGEGGILEGRMVPYSEWTEVRSVMEGHFMERILPGALKKTFMERAHKMRVLFHHGLDSLGKQPIAKLEEVREEADGAYYRARLFPSVPPLILDGLRAGEYGASIGMQVPYKANIDRHPKRSDYNPSGLEERSVTEAALKEFSITAFPVYEGTGASVRALTDDVARLLYGEAVVASYIENDKEGFLNVVRSHALEAEEPTHSEPDEQEAPEAEPEPAEEPAEEEPPKDEPELVEASRDTQKPKPTKDWLSEEEVAPSWVLPQ